MKNLLKRAFCRLYRNETHSRLIERLIEQASFNPSDNLVWIEIGSGLTTLAFAELADRYNAVFYSCDSNAAKIEDLKVKLADHVKNVTFLTGDSLGLLPGLVEKHAQIDFVFLDSAPSAMHTFREYKILEPSLKPGSRLLIDNAALPEEKAPLLTPCRKGKILVPYLLASAHWKVSAHPRSGDSMVSAIFMPEPVYADPAYELAAWKDNWQYETTD